MSILSWGPNTFSCTGDYTTEAMLRERRREARRQAKLRRQERLFNQSVQDTIRTGILQVPKSELHQS